jgi:hypothetical protein
MRELEDTQAFSLKELERRGKRDPQVSLISPNLAAPVDAVEAARLQAESSGSEESSEEPDSR